MGGSVSAAETIARASCGESTGGASPKPQAGLFGHFHVSRKGAPRTLSNSYGRVAQSSAGADTGQPNLASRTILLNRQRSQLTTAGLQTAVQRARQPETGLPGLSGESPRTSHAPGPAEAAGIDSPNLRWVTIFKRLQAQFERYGDTANDAVRKQCHSSYECVVAKVSELYRRVFPDAPGADVIDPIAAYSAIWEQRKDLVLGAMSRLPLGTVARYLKTIENLTECELAEVTKLTESFPAMPTAPPSQSGTDPCPGPEASTPSSIFDSPPVKGHAPYSVPRRWAPKQMCWKVNFLKLQELEAQCRKRGDDGNAEACRVAIDTIKTKVHSKYDSFQGVPACSRAIDTKEAFDALYALVEKAYSQTGPMSWRERGLCVFLGRIHSTTARMVDGLSRSTQAIEPATAPGASYAGRSGPIATSSAVAGTNAGSQRAQSGETEPGPIAGRLAHPLPARPDDFNWITAFDVLHRELRQCRYATDPYASIPCRDAIREIDTVVRCALDRLDGERQMLSGGDMRTETAYRALCSIRDESGQLPSSQDRAVEAGRALQAIDDLTYRKTMELSMRAQDFAAFPAAQAPPGGPPPLFEPRKLADWLQGRARRAQGDVERSSGLEEAGAMLERDYFQCLHQEHDKGRDPWTISRQLLLKLEETARATPAKSLEIAHARLVEAMADPNQRPAEQFSSEVARVTATSPDPLRTAVPGSAPVTPPGPRSEEDPDFSDIGNLFEDLAETIAM